VKQTRKTLAQHHIRPNMVVKFGRKPNVLDFFRQHVDRKGYKIIKRHQWIEHCSDVLAMSKSLLNNIFNMLVGRDTTVLSVADIIYFDDWFDKLSELFDRQGRATVGNRLKGEETLDVESTLFWSLKSSGPDQHQSRGAVF
jgi:hypothetical protein